MNGRILGKLITPSTTQAVGLWSLGEEHLFYSQWPTAYFPVQRALEQWLEADYGVTLNSGSVASIVSRVKNYIFSATGTAQPVLGTDSSGFKYLAMDGVNSVFTVNQTMKAAGIEIANGAEWHAVISFPSTPPSYFFYLDPATGEGRPSMRGYRSDNSSFVAWPEAGQTGGTTITHAMGTNKIVVSIWRNCLTGEIGSAINGAATTSTIATATALARGAFNFFWNKTSGSAKPVNVYASLGYVDNLTPAERAATIASLMAKYGITDNPPVSGAVRWFDASRTDSMFTTSTGSTWVASANDPIGKIKDLTGSGNDLTQAATGSRPAWSGISSGQNSLGTINFSGSQWLDGNWQNYDDWTAYAIMYYGSGTNGRILSQSDGTYADNVQTPTTNYSPLLISTGPNASSFGTTGSAVASASLPSATWKRVIHQKSGSFISNMVGLTTLGSAYIGSPTRTVSKLTIGKNCNGSDGYLTGRLGELIIYPRTLSSAEIAALDTYALAKWGYTA